MTKKQHKKYKTIFDLITILITLIISLIISQGMIDKLYPELNLTALDLFLLIGAVLGIFITSLAFYEITITPLLKNKYKKNFTFIQKEYNILYKFIFLIISFITTIFFITILFGVKNILLLLLTILLIYLEFYYLLIIVRLIIKKIIKTI